METISLNHFESVRVGGDENVKISIKTFIESKSLTFTKGSGFYELSKPETIQDTKEILVQRISDPGTLICGKSVRKVLGLEERGKKKNVKKYEIDAEILKEFKIFVQSTSYNRNLIGGTTFLYKKVPGPAVTPDEPPAKRGRTVSPTRPTTISSSGTSSTAINAGDKDATVEIVFSFDTTGSMYPCLSTVRSVIRDTLSRLTTNIPSIRIGILAHGDYCDEASKYLIKAANGYKFCGGNEVAKLIEFVTNVESTYGGDFPECYELVLRHVRSKFDWTKGANKSLVLIGDAPPHEVGQNPGKIDWRVEADQLKEAGIRVYAVQALDHSSADFFYRELASITLGFHLRLHQLSSVTDFLVAVCYHEGDNADAGGSQQNRLAQFEDELSTAGRMVNNLRGLFDQLRGRSSTTTAHSVTSSSSGLLPVSPSRFQVLVVDEDKSIKEFAQDRGLVFKVGRGFYQFTKPESVSDKKEIVLMDKTAGDFYTGWAAAREFSGIEAGKARKQSPKDSDQYLVFIQSTSYNRKLIKGQKFLYEVDADR